MNILCLIGLHKWKTYKAIYNSNTQELLGLPSVPACRCCQVCNKYQGREEHLLGVNPTRMIYTWVTTKKPRKRVSS